MTTYKKKLTALKNTTPQVSSEEFILNALRILGSPKPIGPPLTPLQMKIHLENQGPADTLAEIARNQKNLGPVNTLAKIAINRKNLGPVDTPDELDEVDLGPKNSFR